VLLARNALTGVVMLRGRKKTTCTLGWNRETDEIALGQWMKGRIYEYRCDLSPDGKHLVYFVLNGHWQGEAKGSWTAISRAPYLKADGLWPQGDTGCGGGLFVDDYNYWLYGKYVGEALRVPAGLSPVNECPYPYGRSFWADGIGHIRYQRDGWGLVDHDETWEQRVEFVKDVGHGWQLVKYLGRDHGGSKRVKTLGESHALMHADQDALVACDDWEWADLDRDRLVWCAKGKLFAGRIGPDGLEDERELYDFNGMEFEAVRAPY
jgi:hypothetical protein